MNTYMYIHVYTCTYMCIHVHVSVCHSLELRELEARLKAGYMNKERAAQLAEKKAIEAKDEVYTV